MKSSPPPAINRRTVFVGAGAVGAVAAAASLLPAPQKAPQQTAAVQGDLTTGRYQLTEHVKHYYATARV